MTICSYKKLRNWWNDFKVLSTALSRPHLRPTLDVATDLWFFLKNVLVFHQKIKNSIIMSSNHPPFWACSQKKWTQRIEYTVTRPCSQQYPNSQKWKSVPIYGCCSVALSCPALCDPMDWSTPGFPVLHYLQEFAQTHVHWVGDAIEPSHPLWPASPPALSLSQHQGLYHWLGSLYQVAKVLELQLHISPSNEYSGLISFRMDWLDLLAVQGTLKSLLQDNNSKT